MQANLRGRKPRGYGPRVGGQISWADLASAAEQLRTVLGVVQADPDHAAYLRGAVDALAILADSTDGFGECLETKVVGHG